MNKNETVDKVDLTPADLQRKLKLGRSTIYEGLRNGSIPSIRIGKKFLIPKVAFDRWLESCGRQQ